MWMVEMYGYVFGAAEAGVPHHVVRSEMMAYVRSKEKEMEEKVDEAAAEVAKLKTGKVVSHLKAMVGSHGAFESATRGGEQLEQLAAANKETSGWTEESVEQSV